MSFRRMGPVVIPARSIIILGFALFAMFFGAGNLIFPPTLGRLTGDQFPFAIMGFLLTGVGLPLLGVLAVAKAEGGLDQIARRVGATIATALSVIVMLAIGPLLAIPRTCATTYELGIAPTIPELGSWTFSFIFFGTVIAFALNRRSVVDRIGRILTPLLIAALAVLILCGVISPIEPPVATVLAHPFGISFVEGYQTMDLMAATIFGIIILNELRSKGVHEKVRQLSSVVKAGLIAAGGLALIYSGLLYLGATTSGIAGEIPRTQLLHMIATRLLGGGGGLTLGIAVSMACLTTAIGLTVVCGEYFSKLSYGRFSYKAICIAVAAVSLVLSNAGVETIVKIALPPLVALYPVVMVIVVLTLLGERFSKRGIWRGAVSGAFLVGLIQSFRVVGMSGESFDALFDILPLAHHGLGWLAPAVVLGAVGALRREKKLPSFRVLAVCPSQLFTRLAIFDDETPVFETAVPHRLDRAMSETVRAEQFSSIKNELAKKLSAECIDLSTINAVVSRGGFLRPLPSGTYRITQAMVSDLEAHARRHHPSNWGAAIAFEIASANDIDAYIVDPVVVDEMTEPARVSGLPEIKRASIFHASNQKAVVRRVARHLWKRHDQINAIVAHIGEGTSVGAHSRGRVIDVNNALDGDGPFSALNAGSLPTVDVVKMCFEKGVDEEKVLHHIRSAGGLLAYIGTADVTEINLMIASGDEKVVHTIEAMSYQVAKEIGGLACTLSGHVDAVILTGEFAGCPHLVEYIKSKVRFLAPVFVYPGESETTALVEGTLRVLRCEENALEYEPDAPADG